ncbi:amino acid adenylation domain-containing protein [Flavobacterium pectinovorum]|uniref:non-ribosomal peptide synthetase n=1 Tax=Flavobacterium pectinovorum TaxID=29533 RepID=UPI00265E47EA|nr:non-ribosomal peptide synthetase [Flavobacterium pectinovorum]WKL50110.1 amino acid adenylation domain-containing protein [Flavobacterium pectinovorum]
MGDMNLIKLINDFKRNDSMLWVDNYNIKLFVSDSFKSEELKDLITKFKSEILNYLLLNKIFSKNDFIKKRIFFSVENESVLSFAQERLWFIEQYEDGTNAYHIPSVFELDAATDIKAMRYALEGVVSRHEVLRSTIEQREGVDHGIQVVHDAALLIEERSLGAEEDYEFLIKEDINRPFDLSREYPIRAKFYTAESEEGIQRRFLLINIHHIASDGWSTDIFQSELLSYYQGYISGDKEFMLPALDIQYKDYAVWQRNYLTGEVLEKQLGYWKTKLSGYQTLEFPTDHARPTQINYKGSHEGFILSKEVSEQLRLLAQRLGVTLHSVMLSSVNILLGKYTGQEDIVIGSPIANRHHRQTENLIGFFVNTQVNRTILSKGQSYESLIDQVHQDQIEGQLHQDLPFEKLVDELGVERDASRHPIFQVMFAVQSLGRAKKGINKNKTYLNAFYFAESHEVEKFDLSIFIDDSQEELMGSVSYATSLFDKGTIESLVGYYKNLLDQLTAFPEKAYSEISLLSLSDYQRIVYEWNATDKDYPQDKTIYEIFQQQVERTPENIALVYEGVELSYAELNARSNQLARYIRFEYQKRTQGELIGDVLIALCMDRGLEMIIAILGVLKAGGAYVPIDPEYPQDRIDYILEDTNAALVLSQNHLIRKDDLQLPLDKVLAVDLGESLYNGPDSSNLAQHSDSKNLAYVIYTSGTTGRPKGVMIEHAGVVNLIMDLLVKYGVNISDRFILFANYIFDASVEQMFLAMLSGARLLIIENQSIVDGNDFTNFVINNGITHLHSTPSYLNTIDPSKFHLLKRVVFGAEYLSKDLFVKYKSHIPTVINEYGPTETTVTSLISVNSNLLNKSSIQNTKAYVLDSNNQPVPLGVVGELYIGGAGLARGYLNREDLTAERFIGNPFATSSDTSRGYDRLYKTGDLVRWLADGNLEYIGRNDDQVKIRGYRIELGEIERALSGVEGISQSCVLVKEKHTDVGIIKSLVGYYVLDSPDVVLDQVMILEELSKVLPEYMIPGALVGMESFPLTINGKLDKRSLPDPDFSVAAEDYQAPGTAMEVLVCGIWQEVLGLARVGVRDNFFRIGGDSILSIQVSSRIRQAGFGCQVKDIFECKSVEKLCKYLEEKNTEIMIDSEQGNLTGSFELLPVQQWFIDQADSGKLAAPNHWNQSFLIKTDTLDLSKLKSIIGELVSYHDILRVGFIKEADGSFKRSQLYRSEIELPELKTLDISHYSQQEIHEYLTDWQRGFDLEHGPLFSVGYLYGYKDESARLYFALHHMLVDGVSWRILADDMRTLYSGKSLPQKGSSYRQWVDSVRNYSKDHPSELSYWEEQLAGMPKYESPDQDQQSYALFLELDKPLTQSLLHTASKAYHTEINDLLLTALAYALKGINQSDVQGITLEGHGRENIDPSIDHSHTVGWFTSMFPVRLEVKESIKESIQFIKESLRNIPNKGVGFGSFATDESVSCGHDDLPGISFNYLGQFDVREGEDNWQVVFEGSGASIDPSNRDHNQISINGSVNKNKLGFSVVSRLGEEKTKELAAGFKHHLEKVIEHCADRVSRSETSYTPSDFNSVRISQSLLDSLEYSARESQNELKYIYPATSLQQGFIYHALSQPDDDVYRVQQLDDYHEPLDVDKYLQAWNNCILEYPILRTAFNWEEDIIQIIYKTGNLEHSMVDISDLATQQERDAAIELIQTEDRKRGFDLSSPTLLRLCIIKQSEDCYTILRNTHHSIIDGWSGPILMTSLHGYYQLLIDNQKVNIKEDTAYLSAQEYIYRHKKDIQSYWDKSLTGIEGANDINALLNNPIDFSSYKQVEQASTNILEISGPLYGELKGFTQREGITINAVVQFVWHKLLQVYSGNKQSIVGTTISGRDLPIEDIENSVGLYINTLPLIIDWDNNNTILSQLHEIQQRVTQMNTHSFVDLAKLQINGERIFHNLFVFENYPAPKGSGKKTLKVNMRNFKDGVDYPLSIMAYEYGDRLVIKLGYDRKYLSEDKAQGHLVTLEYIIGQIIGNPNKLHNEISLLLPSEHQEMVYDWNTTDKDYPVDKTIYELFQAQAESTPDSVALVYDGQELSYRELNERSNQLARHIRCEYQKRTQEALRADSLIALCLDRSLEMVIGILAVLKSGGAYVPIDPEYPQDRIDYILEDTGAVLVLSQKHLLDKEDLQLPKDKVITIDLGGSIYDGQDSSNLPQHSGAKNLAYVIYTSGTTGRPKGVMIEHKAFVQFLFNFRDYVKDGFNRKQQNVLSLTNYVFDIFGLEYGLPLIGGNKVTLSSIYKIKEEELVNIDLVQQTPSSLIYLVTHHFNKLKNIVCLVGGEALPSLIADKLLNAFDRLINVYGPAETVIWSSSYEVKKSEEPYIGKALPNEKAYVLDTNNQPVPVGVIGELHIGGAGLARGYLNRDDLTSERFIGNPFATDADKSKGYDRLYKTGDLVRWLVDGNLEYIGRNDDQVKIRGYRIELGEIEHALSSIAGISQSSVLVRERETSGGIIKSLVGYYVAEEGDSNLDQGMILEQLSAVLPEYMIPGVLIAMDSFPLTINGKLDKRSLPDPDFSVAAEDYQAPSTAMEILVCGIWQEVLGLERVGVTDNFFRIGGNSILAIQVSHRMSSALGCYIKIADIFKYKTILDLLAHNVESIEAVIPKTAEKQSILSFSQERLWFIEQYEQGTNAYHMPRVLELDQATDIAGIKYALEGIVWRHEILRSTIEQSEDLDHGIQVVHDKALFIEEIRLGAEEDYESVIKSDINRPFDLSLEYPIRAKFYTVESESGGERRFLLINIHHIASDGWSMNIFQRELLSYYKGYIDGDKAFALPALDIQYKDFAVWQRNYLSGEVLENQLGYWKSKLTGYVPLEFPTDHLRPSQIDYRGSHQNFVLSKEVSEQLRLLAQRLGVTLHSVMLSSINILLGKYTGQDDIVIGSPIANRHHRQTQDLIGFFVNTQVNRTILSKGQSYVSLIDQVHQDQIEGQLHQDLPFEKLVEELGVDRDASRHPIFQVMFVVESSNTDREVHTQEISSFKPVYFEGSYEVEKFDLSIFIDDSQESLMGSVGYAVSLFDKDTIERFIGHYEHLLAELVKAPEQCYDQISLLLPSEHQEMVYDWNATDKDYPQDKTIYELFQAQAESTPDSVALVYEGQELSYRELNERSNQLARHIRCEYQKRTQEALRADSLIALCLDRSLEMVIGILAVLKSGGAYVPIDPEYPQDRIDYILEDTGAVLVLSQKHLLNKEDLQLPKDKVIAIDLGGSIYDGQDISNLPQHSGAKNLAYVIYTSGTTGRPKGVMIEQDAVLSLVYNDYINIASKDIFALVSSPVFDAATFEIWTPLLNGNVLVIPKDVQSIISDVNIFNRFLTVNEISILWLTKTLFESLYYLNNPIFENLNYLIIGGEALDKRSVNALINSGRRPNYLINGYGPTESTTFTCTYGIENSIESYSIPIGMPINNRKAYVLDTNHQPVPVGVIGELHIGGAGLARGYLNREDLTAERFMGNPFASASDKLKGYDRLYKTGDLVRWLPDGNLEYMGRNDDQVKIRGYRIELGEIEHALSSIAGIGQSCVMARERETSVGIIKSLVGYYVAEGGASDLDQGMILEKLSAVLPEYMIPGALVGMDSFPLTINGKLDKRSLPDPDFSVAAEDYQAPSNAMEVLVCCIWQEVLGLDRVGVTDNFFRIGGNSILAIQVSHRMSSALESQVKVADIFKMKNISILLKNRILEKVNDENIVWDF